METIQTALFEDPLVIYIGLGCIGALGLIYFGFQRTFRSARPLFFAIFAAAAVFAISTLVVTDREKIVAVCDQIAAAINSNQPGDIEPFIAEDFINSGEGSPISSKQKATRQIAYQIKQFQITNVKYKILKLDILVGAADMQMSATVIFENPLRVGLVLDVTWIKRSDQWLIQKVDGRID